MADHAGEIEFFHKRIKRRASNYHDLWGEDHGSFLTDHRAKKEKGLDKLCPSAIKVVARNRFLKPLS